MITIAQKRDPDPGCGKGAAQAAGLFFQPENDDSAFSRKIGDLHVSAVQCSDFANEREPESRAFLSRVWSGKGIEPIKNPVDGVIGDTGTFVGATDLNGISD
jgi:hypothetical protein